MNAQALSRLQIHICKALSVWTGLFFVHEDQTNIFSNQLWFACTKKGRFRGPTTFQNCLLMERRNYTSTLGAAAKIA